MRYAWSEQYPEFKPTLTPREIFLLGSFGGTYWRNIHSSITNKDYDGYKEYQKFPFLRDIPKSIMIKPWTDYDVNINKYKVRVGSTLEEWEKNNWITKYDPYGWVQWYCNFYNGRRVPFEDKRQIQRWINISRFKKRLEGMIAEGKDSPAIRQTLQHWAIAT